MEQKSGGKLLTDRSMDKETRTSGEYRALQVGSAHPSVPQGSQIARFDGARGTRSGSVDAVPGAQVPVADEPDARPPRSDEVARLLERLRTVPEVRADLVLRVGEQLRRGEYLTREAAEQTARALLGARDD